MGLRINKIQGVVLLACGLTVDIAMAQDYYHTDLLRIGGELHQTEESIAILAENEFPPGVYDVKLNVNQKLVMAREIDFVMHDGKVMPCINQEMLYKLGLDLNFTEMEKFDWEGEACIDTREMEYVDFSIDWENRTLNLKVPQIHVDQNRLRKAQETLWDNGVNHFTMNYAFSSYNYTTQETSSSQYVNIRPRANIGAWRFQNYSVWTRGGNQSKWNHISTSASRSIAALRSELSLGDTYSSSSMFDSLKLRGFGMKTSDQMLYSSDRTYVPAINGIANSDSQLTVVQNGNIIYQANLPAGPYSIVDYYPASMGGDLMVSLRETDGTVKTTIVPYAALPIMEKKGHFKYSFSSGSLQEDTGAITSQYVNQLEMVYGLTETNTVYGGIQSSQDYRAVVLGVGSNLGSWGALASDVTRSSHRLQNGQTESGNAMNLNYAKGFETSTMLSMTYSRSLDKSFSSFRTALMAAPDADREKALLNLSLSQTLPGALGALSMNVSRYEFHSGQNSSTYSMGYSGAHKGISFGVYLNKYRNISPYYGVNSASGGTSVSVTASIPLSMLTGSKRSNTSVSYAASRSENKDMDQSVRLSGTAMDHRVSWGAYQGYGNHDVGAYGGVSASYRSGVGDFNAGYAYSGGGNRNFSYGGAGAVTVTPYGSVLSRSLHESNALVVAPHAKDMNVRNQASIVTNSQGLAVVPGMASFRSNTISLATDSIPENVEIDNNIITNLYPTKGALVLAKFNTRLGYKALLTIKDQEIPIGAKAYVVGTDTETVVGGFNQIYVVAPEKKGEMSISWQEEKQEKFCTIDFDLQESNKVGGLYVVEAECLK